VTSFRVAVPDSDLDDLRARLRRTRWPEPATVPDWSQGVPVDYLQDVCRYWADEYDWRARETWFNRFSHYRTDIDGLGVHFIHVRSPVPTATPLVLTHGWPGSFMEFLDVIGPLSDPAAHGGDPTDAFHVVVPSLPGYGWSDRPTETGWGIERIADAWNTLMHRLGYASYGAQGGDWGSAITRHLGLRHPHQLSGIHLNFLRAGRPRDQTEFSAEEQVSIDLGLQYQQWESGYSQQQSTRPQTLGYGLTDSPAGQCAWILEKFWSWSDCGGDPVAAFGVDRLLDNITLYWLSATATSSARLYWESFRAARGGPVTVPVGVSIFPKEIFRPPRHWAERHYSDLRYWNELDRGGHFAAFEQPELFVNEVRSYFRQIR
jgi:pimeloyl-ACP methyl ester carboxylesterase